MASSLNQSGAATNSTGSASLSDNGSKKTHSPPPPSDAPRAKRIACILCRKRKLRCDGIRPSCATCSRLGHECAYDEVRRKSGPKRGYVKALEARLAQVETLLKDQNSQAEVLHGDAAAPLQAPLGQPTLFTDCQHIIDSRALSSNGSFPTPTASASPHSHTSDSFGTQTWPGNVDPVMNWEMVAMGMEEPLPSQEIMDALHQIYFEKVHPSLPIIHRPRYLASLDMAPALRPPLGLRYTMWCLAAIVSDQYQNLQTHFYQLARKYLHEAEMKGHGEGIISVANTQAWSLIACYEFKKMYFPRAWMSTGRAVRSAQSMGLHRLDGKGMDVKQCLPPPRDWIEKEERRRTFWSSFCIDRYSSLGTGWPMIIDEKDILTNLPVSDDAFDRGQQIKSISLKEAMTTEGAAHLSPFGGVCLMASMFGQNLTHLHRPDHDENDGSLNGSFWRRHRSMDNVLLNIAMSLPQNFRLPSGLNNSSIVFTNLNIHTSTICLHQAAIFKAERHSIPSQVSTESRIRCITAAAEIANIMRMVSHLDLSGMNPFVSFCLYVAARVFVQYLKSHPDDEQVRASLQFLLNAMGHMKKKTPLVESFMVQLEIDLTGTLDDPSKLNKFPYTQKKGMSEDPPERSPTSGFHSMSDTQESILYMNPGCPNLKSKHFPKCGNMFGSPPTGSSGTLDATSPSNNSTGQSPASIDLSMNIPTPNSQNQSSSTSSYSPGGYYEYSGTNAPPVTMEDVAGIYTSAMSKDIFNWDVLAFDGPDFDQAMANAGNGMSMQGIHPMSPELNEFFQEGTA